MIDNIIVWYPWYHMIQYIYDRYLWPNIHDIYIFMSHIHNTYYLHLVSMIQNDATSFINDMQFLGPVSMMHNIYVWIYYTPCLVVREDRVVDFLKIILNAIILSAGYFWDQLQLSDWQLRYDCAILAVAFWEWPYYRSCCWFWLSYWWRDECVFWPFPHCRSPLPTFASGRGLLGVHSMQILGRDGHKFNVHVTLLNPSG